MSNIPESKPFQIEEVGDRITRFSVTDTFLHKIGSPNFYLLQGADKAVIVDTGWGDTVETDLLAENLSRLGSPKVEALVFTHGHPDHKGGKDSFEKTFQTKSVGGKGNRVKPTAINLGKRVLKVVPTPGHTIDSLIVIDESTKAVFSGDTVTGRDSVQIEGEVEDYLTSLTLMKVNEPAKILPGHGDVIENPDEKIAEYIKRVRRREEIILEMMGRGKESVEEVVDSMYKPEELLLGRHFAVLNVESHIRKLQREGKVRTREGRLILVENLG